MSAEPLNIQEFNTITGLIFAQLHKAFPGAEDIDIFAGSAPNADPTAPGAVGLSLEDVNFTLVRANGDKVEVALQWTESTDEVFRSYANGIRTVDGAPAISR